MGFNAAGFLISLLGTIGFCVLGTVMSALTLRARARELLLPLVLFPLMIPVILATIQCLGAVLRTGEIGDALPWLRLLIGFDDIFDLRSAGIRLGDRNLMKKQQPQKAAPVFGAGADHDCVWLYWASARPVMLFRAMSSASCIFICRVFLPPTFLSFWFLSVAACTYGNVKAG